MLGNISACRARILYCIIFIIYYIYNQITDQCPTKKQNMAMSFFSTHSSEQVPGKPNVSKYKSKQLQISIQFEQIPIPLRSNHGNPLKCWLKCFRFLIDCDCVIIII